MKIQAVLFDIIGTTIKEKNPDTINHCFEKAFLNYGVEVNIDFLK